MEAENFSEQDKELLLNHVTNLDSNIYCLFNLPPEVVAVLFAYVSRSNLTFRANLLKLIKDEELDMALASKSTAPDYSSAKEKAMKFHDKWVVGYGHSSVAEHAVASIALEDISMMASKFIADNRLASYTGKSSRYQIYDKNHYYKPKNLMNSKHGKMYEETCNELFSLYSKMEEPMKAFVRENFEKPPEMTEKLYESKVFAKTCDIIRYLLPASTHTSKAMTCNARVLEHAISKLCSHELHEYQEIGKKMKEEVQKIIPTLVKYAGDKPYFRETNKELNSFIKERNPEKIKDQNKPVEIVHYDKEAEDKLVAAILYRYTHAPYSQAWSKVKKMSEEEKNEIYDKYLNKMDKHDWPMRELEHVYYTFDILMDYGGWRDVQRHRMATQTNQDITVKHGYEMLPEIELAGFKQEYENAMNKAKETFLEIEKEFPLEAQYVVPIAFKKRDLFTWNLRELHHFIKLRSTKHGHASYRKIAQECWKELNKIHPKLAGYIKVDLEETGWH